MISCVCASEQVMIVVSQHLRMHPHLEVLIDRVGSQVGYKCIPCLSYRWSVSHMWTAGLNAWNSTLTPRRVIPPFSFCTISTRLVQETLCDRLQWSAVGV